VKCEIENCEKNENKNNGKEFFYKNCLITNLGTILSDFQQGLVKLTLMHTYQLVITY